MLGLTACSSSATTPSPASAQSSNPAAAPASPALAADKAVCKQFAAMITGQVLDESQIVALLGQYPAVSPALARDYQAVGNATTVQSGLTAQVNMTADCAIVGVGRIPNTTWPPGS